MHTTIELRTKPATTKPANKMRSPAGPYLMHRNCYATCIQRSNCEQSLASQNMPLAKQHAGDELQMKYTDLTSRGSYRQRTPDEREAAIGKSADAISRSNFTTRSFNSASPHISCGAWLIYSRTQSTIASCATKASLAAADNEATQQSLLVRFDCVKRPNELYSDGVYMNQH